MPKIAESLEAKGLYRRAANRWGELMRQNYDDNLPEMLQMGGKNYMLPGNNGKVFSNKDVNGNPTIPKAPTGLERLHQANDSSNNRNNATQVSGDISINIINSGQPLQVQSQRMTQNDDGSRMMEIFTKSMDEGGWASQAVEKNFRIQRKAGGGL